MVDLFEGYILIVKCGALGDVVRTTALLAPLREKYPEHHITWATSPAAYDLLINNPLLNEIVIANQSHQYILAGKSFDLVISLDDDETSCRFASAMKTKKIVGAYTDKAGHRTYTPDVEPWFGMGLLRPDECGGRAKADELKKLNTQTYEHILCEILGLDHAKAKSLVVIDQEHSRMAIRFFVQKNLNEDALIIGINTGAGGRWQYKKWHEHSTAQLADRLSIELGAKVLLFGGSQEAERNRRIMEMVRTPVINVGTDWDILGFAAIIEQCSLVVSSDSLAMHLAQSVGKPVVAFFGPTPAQEIELSSPSKKITPHMDCLVCYKQTCDFNPSCMDNITVDMMFSAVSDVVRSLGKHTIAV